MYKIVYVKKCLGKDRRPIDIYKIRTMSINADNDFEQIAVHGLDHLGKIKHDPRITPIGRVLRKYWIDEIPQVYNLAKGDIKVVGIRPRSEATWHRYPKSIMDRSLRQKPGLMGIEYAFSDTGCFEQQVAHMDEYLYEWERNPTKTDQRYCALILRNIFIGGIRSK